MSTFYKAYNNPILNIIPSVVLRGLIRSDVKPKSMDGINLYLNAGWGVPNDYVNLVQRFENEEHKAGDIIIPDSKKYANNKIGVGKVLELGRTAKNETKLAEGDYVLYDYYSAYNDTSQNILTKYENIILQLSEEEAYKFLRSELL